MTLEAERGESRPAVCPFVAFEDDRDHRAASPDHLHRCYAETPAAPRALAHQARYCLSPGFASCPIFQDWAAREAAQVVDEPGGAATVQGGAAGAAAAAAGIGAAGEAASGGPAGPVSGPGLFDALRASVPPSVAAGPARVTQRPAGQEYQPGGGSADEDVEGFEDDEGMAAAAPPRDWDRPPVRRNYPRLERRRGIPAWLIGVAALAVVALVLFLAPTFLRGLFGGGSASPEASGTASASALSSASSLGSASPTGPSAAPSATQLTYTVVSGDTLTKIAKKFNVAVQDILAANPTVTNANSIKVDQVLIIPTAGASASASSSP